MKIAITGATGLVGRALISKFSKASHELYILSRSPKSAREELQVSAHFLQWPDEIPALDGVDAVIHLAGESIAKRWSEEHKKKIRVSRIEGTRQLVNGLNQLKTPPAKLISTSAVGYYGSRGDEVLTESSESGHDFLAKVCTEWENEAFRYTRGKVVVTRIAMILSREGGALSKFLLPFRLGFGGPLGDGHQWMSWIHIDDLVAVYEHILKSESFTGVFNASSPEPIRNRDFARTLAKVLRRPAFFPAPKRVLRFLLGESTDFIFASQRALPHRLQESGFHFRFPNLEAALDDLLKLAHLGGPIHTRRNY
jgi:uncharacterized protein